MGGDLAEKSSFTIVKRIAAECVFELNRNVLMKHLWMKFWFGTMWRKTIMRKMLIKINFAKIILHKIFWDGSINLIWQTTARRGALPRMSRKAAWKHQTKMRQTNTSPLDWDKWHFTDHPENAAKLRKSQDNLEFYGQELDLSSKLKLSIWVR